MAAYDWTFWSGTMILGVAFGLALGTSYRRASNAASAAAMFVLGTSALMRDTDWVHWWWASITFVVGAYDVYAAIVDPHGRGRCACKEPDQGQVHGRIHEEEGDHA